MISYSICLIFMVDMHILFMRIFNSYAEYMHKELAFDFKHLQ